MPLRRNPYDDLSKRIYFSFWSWQLIKDCPQSFYLNVIKKAERPRNRSLHNAIQGSIPDAQAEDFFRIPINERDMNFFLDTFTAYWDRFLKENHVDFVAYAKQALKSKKIEIPTDEEKLHEIGYKLKIEETRHAVSNLMRLMASMGFHKAEVLTQVSFNVTIEPSKESGGVFTPELAIGGRIDMVVSLGGDIEEIWDIKAVKNPSQQDPDQLLIYKMGRQAQGKIVKRTGFLFAKQCKPITKKFTPAHEDRIKKMMRQAMFYYRNDSWPANYRSWKCKWCDVRNHCETYRRRTSGPLVELKAGKVDF